MGGGSGGSGWGKPIIPYKKFTEESSETKRFDAEANKFLDDLLKGYNGRDTEAIGKRLEDIKDTLSDMEIDSVSLLFGGSVSKHTYVDGLSDIDVLARLKGAENSKPSDIIEDFAEKLRGTLSGVEIKTGDMAVTLKYKDGCEIQVLPAIETASGLRVPSNGGDRWSGVVKPARFSKTLTTLNDQHSGKLVPVIKLFKAMMASNLGGQKFTGYHAESLAIEAFKSYKGVTNYTSMLNHMCEKSAELVKRPILDKTGQSRHVDDYLGSSDSAQRQQLSRAISTVHRKLNLGNTTRDIQKYEELF